VKLKQNNKKSRENKGCILRSLKKTTHNKLRITQEFRKKQTRTNLFPKKGSSKAQ